MGSGPSKSKKIDSLREKNKELKTTIGLLEKEIFSLREKSGGRKRNDMTSSDDTTTASTEMYLSCQEDSKIKINREEDTETNIDDEINKVWREKAYKYIVFSGGGIKGISFCGALTEFDKYNIITDTDPNSSLPLKLKGLCGVSAGSIIASLIAVGYTVKEVCHIVRTIDFENVVDDKTGYIRDAINFIEDWGVCPGKYIVDIMGQLIKKKTGNPDYTIKNLYDDTGVKLVIVTTNMTFQNTVYLHPENSIEEYSNIPIRTAVRMSMGIPFLFEPFPYNDCVFVDGGVLDNYPIHVFDGKYPGDENAKLNLCTPRPDVIGIKVATPDATPTGRTRQEYGNLFQYSCSFIDTFLGENDRQVITPTYWLRTIVIVTPEYPLTQFKLSEEQKRELINAGRRFAGLFFSDDLRKRRYTL